MGHPLFWFVSGVAAFWGPGGLDAKLVGIVLMICAALSYAVDLLAGAFLKVSASLRSGWVSWSPN
jgi:hypothetical protein